VSEETGKISVAKNGVLHSGLTIDELSQRIKDETS
jgi:DNA integrity scanning protein DisA with diadenylate cyclase activity